jgi:cytoskeletal protein CcmA (bactofilin family)
VTLPPTVIPSHTRVDGRIETPADLTVEGRCDGQLEIGGTLRVVPNATCKAAIQARVADIRGEVIGDVVCTEAISVARGARVVGNLRAPDVSVDSGCEVDGKIDLLAPAPEEAPIRRVPVRTRGSALRRPQPPPREKQ